jgi:cobalt-zinc-cadmium efflux system outer membrane protein
MSSSTSICGRVTAVLLVGLAGCTVHPPGELEERATAVQVGKPFEKPTEVRQMPPLPANPTSDQLVEHALLGNAALEQHYWEWRSAIEQIPQDATQTTTLNVAAGTSITNGHTSLGSNTLTLSNDPMTDIKWPDKLDAAAKQALENARATGRRFFKAKYDLRYKVLKAYYDYALTAELIRLEQSNQRLLQTIATVAETRNRAGRSGQRDLLKSSNEVDLSSNDVANMQSQLPGQRAAINALLSRPADAPLAVPTKLPPSRRVVYRDRDLVEIAAKQNPELIALADEIRGRDEGIRLAKLQYVPDFNLSVGSDLMGVTQSLLAQATIPFLRYEALNAAIAQAEAKLRASEAMRQEVGNNLTAQVIADIKIIRDADRQLDLFDHTILPRARQVVNVARTAFETGDASEADAASLLNLLDDQRSLIAIERLAAKIRITRETHLAELESITTTDLTRLPHTGTRAAAQ